MIEFDPHKTEDSNVFTASGVPVGGALSRVFLFPEAPFYTTGSVVKNNGVTLTEGKDFAFVLPFVEMTHKTARRVFSAVFVFGDGNPSIAIEAHSIGTRYQVEVDTTKNALDGMLIPELLDTSWDTINNNPYVPLVSVQFQTDTWYGEEELSAQLKVLENALSASDITEEVHYMLLDNWVTLLEGYTDNPELLTHLQETGNVHNHTPEELGARRINNNAADTARLFGRNKTEMLVDILRDLPQLSDLDNKLTKAGGTIDVLRLHNAFSLISNDRFIIDAYGGRFNVTSNAEVAVAAPQTIEYVIGGHILTLDGLNSVILLDGKELITGANVDREAANNATIEADIKTTDSDSVTWEGSGSTDDPLKPSLSKDTYLGHGIDTISHAPTQGLNKGASPKAGKVLTDTLIAKAEKGNLIANRPFNGNVTLSQSDFVGAENLENFSDEDMPLSDAVKEVVADKAVVGHRHDVDAFNLPNGDESTAGPFRYGGNDAMQAIEIKDWFTSLSEYSSRLRGMIESETLNVRSYGEGDGSPVLGVTKNGFRITIPAMDYVEYGIGKRLTTRTLDFATVSDYKNRYFYISVNDNGYTFSKEASITDFVVGWVYTDNVGVLSMDIRQDTRLFDSATTEGHMLAEGDGAHDNQKFDKEFLGLTNVEDYPMIGVPTSESEGYATTFSVAALFCRHNTYFKKRGVLTAELRTAHNNGNFLQSLPPFLIRQMPQLNPSQIPIENQTYTFTNDGGYIVYASLPQDGYVDESDPNTPNPVYPIGSRYYTAQDYNPSNYLGGTWVAVPTFDIPEEHRQFYNTDVGGLVEWMDLIPESPHYRYVVLLPGQDYNAGVARDIVISTGQDGLVIDMPQSPVVGAEYPFMYSEAGIKSHILIWKEEGTLTPLEDPKYIWERVE